MRTIGLASFLTLLSFSVPALADDYITVQMPAWSPGDYHVQNHARYVQDFRADGLTGSRQTGVKHVTVAPGNCACRRSRSAMRKPTRCRRSC